jgi:hypothetical protein
MPAGPADLDLLSERLARTPVEVVLAESRSAALTDRHLEPMYRHPRPTLLLVSPDGATPATDRLAQAVLAATRRRAPAEDA